MVDVVVLWCLNRSSPHGIAEVRGSEAASRRRCVTVRRHDDMKRVCVGEGTTWNMNTGQVRMGLESVKAYSSREDETTEYTDARYRW